VSSDVELQRPGEAGDSWAPRKPTKCQIDKQVGSAFADNCLPLVRPGAFKFRHDGETTVFCNERNEVLQQGLILVEQTITQSDTRCCYATSVVRRDELLPPLCLPKYLKNTGCGRNRHFSEG
jgi:hypothetical protein